MSWQGAVSDPFFDPAIVEDPYGYYAELRETDPVHELPGTDTFLVTRMDLIHEVVAKPAVFSSVSAQFLHHRANGGAPGLRGVSPMSTSTLVRVRCLATADPPDHGRQRKVVTRRLSTTVMQEMEPEFRELVDRTLEPAADGAHRVDEPAGRAAAHDHGGADPRSRTTPWPRR